jgi:pimeloyl-ACP methyl ester carboxylesterase
MPKAQINGIELYYEVHGQGPAVVFAHGAGGNHLSWWQQVPVLARQYRCISFDHRGFGQSLDVPHGPGSQAFVQDLKGLLDHLEIERAALVAQSMGGRTCLGFTLAYPERVPALVMADTTGGFSDARMAQLRAEGETALAGANPPPRTYARHFPQEQPASAFLYEQIRALNPPRQEAAGPGPTAEQVRALRTPTLLIVGEHDVIAPPALMKMFQNYIPHARLAEVAGAGHSVYFEKSAEFNRLVQEFFAEVGV